MDIDKLLLNLRSISDNMGIYPAAVSGYNAETSYEQRDGFKNGWNACIIEYGAKLDYAIESACTELSSAEKLFLADGDLYSFSYDQESGWSVFLNDTWYYACGDGEDIPKEKYNEVANWYRQYGGAGVLYWVYLQRGHLPSIPVYRRQVELVANLIGEDLQQSKSKAKSYLAYIYREKISDKDRESTSIARDVFNEYNKMFGACPLSWDEIRYFIKDLKSWSYRYIRLPVRSYLRELTRKLYRYFC